MLDKTLRLVQLGPKLAASYTGSVNLEIVKRAATLAKADLATNLVKEFPELQGTIGQCYAGLDGEPEAVAKAIYEHYLPKGKDDAMPQSIESALIALADKFDNLVGLYFACGAPTSSKDPYALRRQAFGIVKLLCAFDISVDVNDIIETCLDLIGAVYHELLVSRIAKFLYDRFKIYLKDNFRPDLIDAVLRVSSDNVAFDYKKLQCLDKFLATQEGLNTFRSIKRVLNIITKDSTQTTVNIKLMNAHDKHLYAKVKGITASNNTVQIHSLADLSKTIDDFFDKVLIMDENLDVRSNRLALLKLASAAFLDFADFSCIKI
jgi:glycyl-tRNA synthetase beta chain